MVRIRIVIYEILCLSFPISTKKVCLLVLSLDFQLIYEFRNQQLVVASPLECLIIISMQLGRVEEICLCCLVCSFKITVSIKVSAFLRI